MTKLFNKDKLKLSTSLLNNIKFVHLINYPLIGLKCVEFLELILLPLFMF